MNPITRYEPCINLFFLRGKEKQPHAEGTITLSTISTLPRQTLFSYVVLKQ